MKRHLFYLMAIAITAATITACSKNDDDDDGSSLTGDLSMITKSGDEDFSLLMKGSGTITVNWGDGQSTTYTVSSSNYTRCEHKYSNASTRTITVTGGDFTDFNFSRCDLTALNVRGCTSLKYLSCFYNRLSAAALNNLFGTLHSNDVPDMPYKVIDVSDNPGAADCDISIATRKGWEVYYD